MNCKRCGDTMTMHVVGDRYCLTCKREMRAVEPKPRTDAPLWLSRLRAKEMTDYRPVA